MLILGTGFTAKDFLAPMAIRGRGGRDLNEAWRDGAEAYLGMTVAGFPNMFMLYGPNTNLGAGSIVYMLESQIDYVVEAVRTLARTRIAYIDVRAEVQSRFNEDIQTPARRQRLDRGVHELVRDRVGQGDQQLARVHLRVPPAHPQAGPRRLRAGDRRRPPRERAPVERHAGGARPLPGGQRRAAAPAPRPRLELAGLLAPARQARGRARGARRRPPGLRRARRRCRASRPACPRSPTPSRPRSTRPAGSGR